MAGLGWYGPLINLSMAPSHIDDYVQFIVFVHRSNPVQYKLAKGGTVIRADIHVGDETRPFFSVSLWNKHLADSLSSDVKVIKFGNIVEARTVQYSSVCRLIHPYHSLLSKGVDELMSGSRVVGTAKEKLRRVIEWVQLNRVTLCNELKGNQKPPAPRNWKHHQELISRKCSSLSEVIQMANPSKVNFHASVGEIFLQSSWHESDKEKMFLSRRLATRIENIEEDMICTGCQLCGSPLCSDSTIKQENGPLYCSRSSNRLHVVGLIYRPFMLYVWDDSDYIPLLVTNKAAEFLFGNIIAEKVYQSYKEQKNHPILRNLSKEAANVQEQKTAEKEVAESCSSDGANRPNNRALTSLNFYSIWLVVLKMLLVQGENSPLKFEALVNPSLKMEDGRFEMISMSMPYVGKSSPRHS